MTAAARRVDQAFFLLKPLLLRLVLEYAALRYDMECITILARILIARHREWPRVVRYTLWPTRLVRGGIIGRPLVCARLVAVIALEHEL
ncbi:hypothetical protein DEM34_18000 [Spiribacter halobius]|uniref:Uncharacterized protein n=1 Tax=Sediminicurvatus halobius TaxID=2182432 RepID=A0A2U2MW82_9GAMM|nr:hypothetical protein DEM34_18000 [Spiribacter halobius]